MPAIKNIAATKKKSGNYDSHLTPLRKPLPPSMPWRKKKSGRGVSPAKNGWVKKVTKLTATFSPSSYGKKGMISSKPKLL